MNQHLTTAKKESSKIVGSERNRCFKILSLFSENSAMAIVSLSDTQGTKLTIGSIAVTTTSYNQDDVTIVTENKC